MNRFTLAPKEGASSPAGEGPLAALRGGSFPEWLASYFLGDHPLIHQVRAKVVRACCEERPVLLTGETGTGKDFLAQAIHAGSSRGRVAPQVVAVAGLGDTAWSVLFGHRRGSFTGADREHQGLFQSASGSTLILEDVSDLPMSIQPMLLRAIEHGLFRPLGSDQELQSDVRIVSTTNLPLENQVAAGRFRSDLYQRLSVLRISLPPLREHIEDLHLYASHFLSKAATSLRPPKRISPAALRILKRYSWPRNVRELEHLLYHASVDASGEEITPADLENVWKVEGGTDTVSRPGRRAQPSRVLSRTTIVHALEESGGNKRKTAKALGISPGTLYSLMRKHRIYG